MVAGVVWESNRAYSEIIGPVRLVDYPGQQATYKVGHRLTGAETRKLLSEDGLYYDYDSERLWQIMQEINEGYITPGPASK